MASQSRANIIMSCSRKSPPGHDPSPSSQKCSVGGAVIEKEKQIHSDQDFEYFKRLWDQSIMQNNDEPPPKKKRRKAAAVEKRQKAGSLNGDSDNIRNGPIENMDFVKDGKEEESRNNIETKMAKKPTNRTLCRPSPRAHRSDNQKMPRWDQQPLLYQHSSLPEIENLVGWATSHRCDHDHDLNTNSARRMNNNPLTDDDEARRLGLIHIPTAPPPPSHVGFLQRRISERIKAGSIKTGETAAAAVGDKEKGNDGTIPKQHTTRIMDTSAYIAVGMAVEEALTAKLMPLAQEHAARCRRLERQRKNPNNKEQSSRRSDSDPFHAWTLPPAEAIAQLARDDVEFPNQNDGALVSLLDRHYSRTNR